MTVSANGAETIDGSTSQTMVQYDYLEIVWSTDAGEWLVIS